MLLLTIMILGCKSNQISCDEINPPLKIACTKEYRQFVDAITKLTLILALLPLSEFPILHLVSANKKGLEKILDLFLSLVNYNYLIECCKSCHQICTF